LANLSIEKPVDDPDSKVTGHIRIRAKSQVRYGEIPGNPILQRSFDPSNLEFPFRTGHGLESGRQDQLLAEAVGAGGLVDVELDVDDQPPPRATYLNDVFGLPPAFRQLQLLQFTLHVTLMHKEYIIP